MLDVLQKKSSTTKPNEKGNSSSSSNTESTTLVIPSSSNAMSVEKAHGKGAKKKTDNNQEDLPAPSKICKFIILLSNYFELIPI